jgi:hypothetical protein
MLSLCVTSRWCWFAPRRCGTLLCAQSRQAQLAILTAHRGIFLKLAARWTSLERFTEHSIVLRCLQLINGVVQSKLFDSLDHHDAALACLEVLQVLCLVPSQLLAMCAATVPSFGASG